MLPRIGLIYLTFATKNWETDINRCLTSLTKINYPKDRIELICVESLSPHGRVQEWFNEHWLPKSENELPRITYLFSDQRAGFDRNNNNGYAKAKELGCDYVYLLNEDTDVDPDFLRCAVERAEADPKVAVVQSLILLGENRNEVNSIGNAYHYLGFGYSLGYHWTRERALSEIDKLRQTNPELEISYASGAGMLARISIIEECGGLFDEGFFMYHEDTDASMRPKIRGYKVVLEPRSVVYHFYEFAKSRWVYFYMERNRYAMMFSYYRPWTLILLLPMMVVLDLAELGFSILRGWWREKLKVYAEWFSPKYWKWIKERRRKIQVTRVISDREFLRLAVSEVQFQEAAIKNPVLDRIGNPLMRVYLKLVRKLI